ncbi:hypothetical protein L1887_28660 [Cichorium endivia]|nr:hypothetical protein L1887_28660 [Cichorium endivia]
MLYCWLNHIWSPKIKLVKGIKIRALNYMRNDVTCTLFQMSQALMEVFKATVIFNFRTDELFGDSNEEENVRSRPVMVLNTQDLPSRPLSCYPWRFSVLSVLLLRPLLAMASSAASSI